jgi:hypothetical protein
MGSQRDLPERMSNTDQVTDDIFAANNSTPSDFSFSDFSSNDSNYDINDAGSQSGLSTTREELQEPLSSSQANEDLSSGSLNMGNPYTCDKCPKSFEKRYDLK